MSLTIPMILGISSSLVAAVFETWLLGRISTETLAAYSFTFPVVGALTSCRWDCRLVCRPCSPEPSVQATKPPLHVLPPTAFYLWLLS